MKDYSFVCEMPSKSNPNKHYNIKVDNSGMFSCDCPAWIFNVRRKGVRSCKHIDELRGAGFTIQKDGAESGKILFTDKQDRWGYGKTNVPVLCKNYPDKCDACALRFACFTESMPKFSEKELSKNKVIGGNS
jgi:hypothetical protein